MEQGSIDDDLATLEEWYTEYMTQKDPTAAFQVDTSKSESLDLLEAYEAETLQLMRNIDVTDGFCSTCHTMLDNWPDLEPWMEGQAPMTDGDKGPRISAYSSSTDLCPGAWIEHENQVKYVLPWQGQIARLDSAARNGCRFCALALQTIKDDDLLVLYRLIESRLCRLGKPSKISFVVYTMKDRARNYDIIDFGFPGRLFHECAISYKVFQPPSLYIFRQGKSSNELSHPCPGTSWQASASQSLLMKLAQRWISNCIESHPDCNLERPPSYPSRLLSIAVDPIRLVVTEQWIDRPPYATLSHCWGTTMFETLKTTNFDELQRGVPDRLLSKTFVHAVYIARAVGLGYLWIDSLCILQDSKKDWEIEASTMASVYGGSSLNIAASSARNGSEGCFLKPLNHAGGFTAQVCTNGEQEIVEFSPGNEYSKNVTCSHLATRGWTLQEKVLPPRTLHCSDQGLFWECRAQQASEYFPDGFADTNFFLWGSLMQWDNSNHWERLKEWYCRCDLTDPGDKLIALSGVARAIQHKTGDQYFAGLWRKTFAQELCWVVQHPRQRPQYRAPSWSWAAIDGPVLTQPIKHSDGDLFYVNVHSVSVIHPGGNTLGSVLHGTLSLQCDIIFCGSVVAEDMATAKRRICSIWHDYNPDQAPGTCFSSLGQIDNTLPFHLDCAEQKDSRAGQTIYYLPLRVTKFLRISGGSEITHDQVFGLVVEKTDTTLDQYRRIGHFNYHHQPGQWDGHDDGSECFLAKDYFNFMELIACVSSSGCGGLTLSIV